MAEPSADIEHMRRALALGERARATCGAGPWAGCVIVARDAPDSEEVVGEGAYLVDGGPHAEARAVAAAGERARGATAYVTLEPCDHHGRTPPCTDTLVGAGVRRVVVAVTDPDERVSGRGIARLRDAGIEVALGVGDAEAGESLRPYLHHRSHGVPWCVLKTAMSADGRIAAADGSSQWITGDFARGDVHRLRAESQAVVVGSGTALADRPLLTARDVEPPPPRQPLRVLLDARGRTPATGPLFDLDAAPTLVLTAAGADIERVRAWKDAGAEVEEVEPGRGVGVALDEVVALLGRRGIVQALFEGGAGVHGSLLEAGLADEVIAYVAPFVLGPGGRPMVDGIDVATIGDAERWKLIDTARLGDDVRLTWRPGAREAPGRPG